MRLEVIDGDYDSSRRCKEFIARLSDCQGLCVRKRIAGRGRGLRGKGGTRGAVAMLGRDILRLGAGHGDGREKGLAKGLRRGSPGRLRCENQGSRIERHLFER